MYCRILIYIYIFLLEIHIKHLINWHSILWKRHRCCFSNWLLSNKQSLEKTNVPPSQLIDSSASHASQPANATSTGPLLFPLRLSSVSLSTSRHVPSVTSRPMNTRCSSPLSTLLCSRRSHKQSITVILSSSRPPAARPARLPAYPLTLLLLRQDVVSLAVCSQEPFKKEIFSLGAARLCEHRFKCGLVLLASQYLVTGWCSTLKTDWPAGCVKQCSIAVLEGCVWSQVQGQEWNAVLWLPQVSTMIIMRPELSCHVWEVRRFEGCIAGRAAFSLTVTNDALSDAKRQLFFICGAVLYDTARPLFEL